MMKKRIMLALVLTLCVLVLCACGSQEQQRYTVVTQNNPQATQNLSLVPTEVPAQDYNFDDGSYDPTSEEGDDGDFYIPEETPVPNTPAPTVRGEYAGATPVIIDPIDKPSPTPVPAISFTYQTYDATDIRLSFQAPAGWSIAQPEWNTVVLTNPAKGVDYAAQITISASNVSSAYDTSDLKKVVKNMLDQIGDKGFTSFSPSNTAERTLLDSKGIYANYTGTMTGKVEVAGRVHATYLNGVLYTVHVSYPRAYTETYKEQVYDKLRETMVVK